MFPERWLAGNYKQTRRSRLNSRRTSTAEVCWPRKRRLELPGTTSWDVVEKLQAGTCGHPAGGLEAEEQKQRRRRSRVADGKARRSARTRERGRRRNPK
eukprot:10437567-Heterocapsa_arctica.AAC.1